VTYDLLPLLSLVRRNVHDRHVMRISDMNERKQAICTIG